MNAVFALAILFSVVFVYCLLLFVQEHCLLGGPSEGIAALEWLTNNAQEPSENIAAINVKVYCN